MNWLPQLSVDRPITSIMFFISICVLGIIAWIRIPIELLPKGTASGNLWVQVPYTDSQPRATEEAITLPVEDRLSDIEGLKSIRSTSRAGNASFSLEFHRSISMDNAYNSVVDRLERAMLDLPDEADRYYIFKWDASDAPIIWLAAGIDGNEEDRHNVLNDIIKPKFERVPGVGSVDAWGPAPKKIFVGFSRDALMNHRLNQFEIIQKIRSESFQMPNGRMVENGTVSYVRSLAQINNLEALKQFPASENLSLNQVANISMNLALSGDISRIQGKQGAGVSIRKESDANTVATTSALLEAMEDLKSNHPVDFFVFFNQGELIKGALNNLKESAMTGGFFAVFILYLFLRNLSMTLLIAACIPFTLVMSVATLYLRGSSLNLLSLMGLMLAVGMVVDNAIVVVESIYAKRLDGESAKSAAVSGSVEVALAISLSTLTTVAVFLPVILMNQDTEYSLFLIELGFPIVIALGASLLAALAFTPLTTTFLKSERGDLVVPRGVIWLTQKYRSILKWILNQKSDSILALLCLSVLTIALPVRSVGCSSTDEDASEFVINYEVPPQLNYNERLNVVKKIEEVVEDNKERWGVRFYYSRINNGSNNGRCEVYLHEDKDKSLVSSEIAIKEAQDKLPEIPGVEMNIGWSGSYAESRSFELILRGDQTSTLEDLAKDTAQVLKGVEGVMSVDLALEEGSLPELQLSVNRQSASRYGLSAQTIAWTVASALRSNDLPDQKIGSKSIDVIARFQYSDRSDMNKLLDFPVLSTSTMQLVPLRKLVDIKTAPSLQTIRRRNRTSSYPISISISENANIDTVRSNVNVALSELEFPTGYGFDPPFDPDDLEDQTAMQLSLLMSIVLVFLIMGALFESFLLPMAIITTIPMAALGAFWVLYISDSGMDNIAGIGLVILVGVVVNNGIVLIENINRLREAGLDRNTAILEGGTRRLRPILMTALTTIFGLLPMAFGGTSEGGISYASMGKVVTGGLATGTFLTLFFVPLLYVLLDDMKEGASRWLAWAAPSLKNNSIAK
ncbi:MAG: hypothetical protein CMK59_02615 [Proteobacteria bacterium]|nr:hypothetical protein [Pseudomonadota bacterium]